MLEVTSRAARIEAKSLFHGLTLPGNTERLWSEAMNWACLSINAIDTSANAGRKSPFEMRHGRRLVHRVVSFLQPDFYNRVRQRKIENRGVPGFYLGPAPNHPKSTMCFLDGRTRHVVITRDMTWLLTVMIPELEGASSTAPKTVE